MAAPLTDLTKKGAFVWSKKAQSVFDKFKKIMSSCPVLAIPDFSKPFELQCDAFGEGIGAVLMQEKHPIVFESRKLRELREIIQSMTRRCLQSCTHWPSLGNTWWGANLLSR